MALNGDQKLVSFEQYQYALTNFKIAHDEVEKQRRQLEEQERQVAQLRQRIAVLEGGGLAQRPQTNNRGGSSVDDFSIRHAASQLAAQINRWAGDIVRTPPASLNDIRDAIISDVNGYPAAEGDNATSLQVQNLLRHVMSETIAEGVINCLIVTNSSEANVQLTRIHEHLFARDPLVACVWRRQTFSAAVESCTPEMSDNILRENLHAVSSILSMTGKASAASFSILEAAYAFSRMLHASSAGGTTEAFYRAFVPELGSVLDPRQIELVKRCMMSERGHADRVGACVFPGLVKVTQTPPGSALPGQGPKTRVIETVVRRAQVICQCALTTGVPSPHPAAPGTPAVPVSYS